MICSDNVVYSVELGTKDLPYPQPVGYFDTRDSGSRKKPPIQIFNALAFLRDLHEVWQASSAGVNPPNAQLHARQQVLNKLLAWAGFTVGDDRQSCYIQLPDHFEVWEDLGDYLVVGGGKRRLQIAIKAEL